MSPSTAALAVELGGMSLRLDPRGAVIDPGSGTGFVADLHLGKATLFRRRGLAVPDGDEAWDLARLDAVIQAHELRRLVVLGDLVHAAGGLAAEVVDRFAAWRRGRADLDLTLVRGNHDRGAGPLPEGWVLDVVDAPWPTGGITCVHEPPDGADGVEVAPGDTGAGGGSGPVLAGHVHPVVRIGGRGQGRGLRARCFWWRRGVLVLPAFGAFTGGHAVVPARDERLFAVPPPHDDAGSPVVELPVRGR